MRVAYCTAGTVGAGHFVRGVAIARGLRRVGFGGEYRAFGPPLAFPAVEKAGYRALRGPGALARALRRFAPDLLLVDLFWAPVRPLLDGLGAEAWLLLRSCPPNWLDGAQGARRRFARVVAIEPLPHAPQNRDQRLETIDPIVVANRDECRPASALRERLGVPRRRKLVAVAHAGENGESARLLAFAGKGAVSLDLRDPAAPFPVAEWLGGADAIVAGGGYNAYWEARWLGYARRARFHPFARAVDDQAWRVAACKGERPRANGADTLARWILRGG